MNLAFLCVCARMRESEETMKIPVTQAHLITERESPVAMLLRCKCGWHKEITRKQNALARAAKVKAAVHEHIRWIAQNA